MTDRSETILGAIRRRIMGDSYATPAAPSIAELQAKVAQLEADKMELAKQLAEAVTRAERAEKRLNHARGYLRAIAARETAKPNAASRDMARLAREALE